MATTRIRHTTSQREFEQVRDEYITQGYKIQSEGDGNVIVRQSSWGSVAGHIGVALFTVWWTLGLGNLAYALVAHKSDEVMVKLDTGA